MSLRFEAIPLAERRQRLQSLHRLYPGKAALVFQQSAGSRLSESKSFRFVSRGENRLSKLTGAISSSLGLGRTSQLMLYTLDGRLVNPDLTVAKVTGLARQPDGFVYLDYCEVASFGM